MGINRRLIWLVCAAVPTIAFAACVGDAVVVTADAGPDVTTTFDAAPDVDEPFEAGVELDSGVAVDGGGDPDEPDGAAVIDAGKDAGVCGPPSGTPPTITSKCATFLTSAGGGTLSTVSYHLTAYYVYGSTSYCSSFVGKSYAGKLVITKNPNNTYNFAERVTATGTIYLPPGPNKNFSVIPSGTNLAVSQTCGSVVSDSSWPYTSGGTLGARTISYLRTSGTASVKMYWTQD